MERARRVHTAVLAGAMVLAVAAITAGARSQRPSPSACEQRCRGAEQAQRAHCGDDRCRGEVGFRARRCMLACNTSLSAVDRCRAECDIDSDECDFGCRSQRDERGCLRRCGSRHHISCPQECAADPDHRGPF